MVSPNTAPGALLEDARALLPDLVELRRTLHRRPEVGLQLPETQAIVVAELERLGLATERGTSLSSVIARIGGTADGAADGPTILLRADMDGLPLNEDSGLDFASTVEGAMHACGHDTHVTMLLGAARLLLARRDLLAGRVVLMFQPGEEGHHGARFMLDEGLLDAPAGGALPSDAFAIHISTRYPSGTVLLRAGAMLAANDTLRIVVRGRGGHASTPHLALDPIPIAAEIVLGLQTLVGRRVDVFDPAVVTIAHMAAGTTTNVIPEEALLEGTIRTVSERTRTVVAGAVRQLVAGIVAAHGAAAEITIVPGYPVTINDAAATERVTAIATELIGADRVVTLDDPVMGAEDFSYVLQRVPGAFAWLGGRPAEVDPATAPQNHSNRVVFDESAMAVGVALYAGVALRALAPR
ncbi:MAG: M20 family metallopeptidase [Candidatus Limnocylindrales bacterium]